MADIAKSLPILYTAEFSKPKNALHVNKTENGYTFMGIYQKAHPNWSGFKVIEEKMKQYKDIEKVSELCYDNPKMREYVEWFYKREFWDKMKLDKVNSQHIANEMFIFAVVANYPPAIRAAQRLVGVFDDGVIGEITLNALNAFDEKQFDLGYDQLEEEHFEAIVTARPEKMMFLNGWINRAHLV